jgi:hypothetical protein
MQRYSALWERRRQSLWGFFACYGPQVAAAIGIVLSLKVLVIDKRRDGIEDLRFFVFMWTWWLLLKMMMSSRH